MKINDMGKQYSISNQLRRIARGALIIFVMMLGVGGLKAEEPVDSIVDENFVITSLLVADPGDVLYSTVGHVALRMECPQYGHDYVFSYESEDVSEKVFSFLAGNLKMGMFAIPTKEYLDIYRKEGRGVRQYTLNLPIDVKRNLWRVLDNHLMEGMCLSYDYLERGCAHGTLNMLKETLDTIPIQYESWPETFSSHTCRELVHEQLDEHPWSRCFLHLIANGGLDFSCSNEKKVILPADLVYVLQHAKVCQQQLLSNDATELLPSGNSSPAHWCSPTLVAVLLLLSVIGCFFVRCNIMDYILLALQTLLGVATVYLIFFSSLICTEWSWLIIPFNPLPLLFWKWRHIWCLPYATIIGFWILFMWLWPHTLTDTTYIVLALALIVSYINIFRTHKI